MGQIQLVAHPDGTLVMPVVVCWLRGAHAVALLAVAQLVVSQLTVAAASLRGTFPALPLTNTIGLRGDIFVTNITVHILYVLGLQCRLQTLAFRKDCTRLQDPNPYVRG